MKEGDWDGFLIRITMWNNIAYNSLRMWYIPALMIMYLLLPLYIEAYKKCKYVLWSPLVIIAVISYLSMTINMEEHIYFFMAWQRLPIFLIGINMYLLKDSDIKINDRWLVVVALVFTYVAWMVYCSNGTLGRFSFIPIVLAMVYFADRYITEKWRAVLTFFGGFTLELYLIQEYIQKLLYENTGTDLICSIMPLPFVQQHVLGVQSVVCAVLALPLGIFLAYVYHLLLQKMLYTLER